MTKAAAPMTGGMIWPPVELTASTEAANEGRKPMRFISGMENAPVVMTLATAEPDTDPNRPLVMQATLAGPPACRPVRAIAKSMNSWPTPMRSTMAPKMMNSTMKVAETATGMPKMPSVVRNNCSTSKG